MVLLHRLHGVDDPEPGHAGASLFLDFLELRLTEVVVTTEADLRKKASLATNQEGPLPSPFLPLPSSFLPSFPPLHSPFPPLPFFPLLSPPFPFRPLPLEVRPFFAARGSGGALKLPQRVRAEPGRQMHFGAF